MYQEYRVCHIESAVVTGEQTSCAASTINVSASDVSCCLQNKYTNGRNDRTVFFFCEL